MVGENNSLEKYLESEIERLQKDIENRKSRHYVNQKIIEECQERIRDYRDKEDSVFNLLSPVSIESSYKDQIDSENRVIEQTNEENLKLIAEIAECNEKINEIRKQLQSQKDSYTSGNGMTADIRNDRSAKPDSTGEAFRQEWRIFINNVLDGLKQAEEDFYSNPASCKERISKLREYIIRKCYGE